jgi:antitoxin component YwqK of YwqJK toxin-antitoxin module
MGFFSNRRNKIIEEEITNALLYEEGYYDTSIYWQAFEKFAQEHGGTTDKYEDGGQDTGFEMIVNGIEVKVMAIRDRYDGTASIKVQLLADFKTEVDEFLKKAYVNSINEDKEEEGAKVESPYKMFTGENEGVFKDGKYTTHYDNGQVRRVTNYKPGTSMKEGKHTVWYEDGQLSREEYYKEEDKDPWSDDNFNPYKWTEWHKNGQMSEKSYHRDEELESYKSCEWFENGQIKMEAISEDKKEGSRDKITRWYENGQIESIQHKVNDDLDGKWTEWYENGHMKSDGNWSKGHVEGKLTEWYENGQICYEYNYQEGVDQLALGDQGVLDGKSCEWYENGQIKSEEYYKNDLKDGSWTTWFENGNISTQGSYINDKKDGEWKEYFMDGRLAYTRSWKDGVQLSGDVEGPDDVPF